MRKLLKDRVILIRAMIDSCDNLKSIGYSTDSISSFIDAVRKDENQHFLSISQEVSCEVSYAKSPEHKYDSRRRIRTSLGKYYVRNFKPECQENLINMFVNYVWKDITSKHIDDLVIIKSGNDLLDVYDKAYSTSNSCMTGKANSSKVKFYAENPDKVSIITYENLRALLWTCDDGTKVLDRIYPARHSKMEILRTWASNKGIVLRNCPDELDTSSYIELSDGKVHEITMDKSCQYPYIDTFTYGKKIGNKIILSNRRDKGSLVFRSTDGNYYSQYSCYDCSDNLEEDEVYYDVNGHRICENCRNENYFSCENCGESYHINNVVVVNDCNYCEDCVNEIFTLCSVCHEYCDNHDVIQTADTDRFYCEDCSYRRKIKCCEDCGHHIEENIYEIDGEFYCGECCFECHECGEHFLYDDVQKIKYKYYCDKCCKKCANCGKYHSINDILYIQDLKENYCERCISDKDLTVSTCSCCDEYFIDGIHMNNNKHYCKDCFIKTVRKNHSPSKYFENLIKNQLIFQDQI